MAKKLRGLGRGLDAILPDSNLPDAGLQEIRIGEIDPNPDQPRRSFAEDAMADLTASIREQGVLQPLLVCAGSNGRYRIIAGERRWRAARAAGLDTVPCLVRDLDAVRRMEVALIENLQREDLNAVEQALGIRALMQHCGYTQEQAANRLGKSRPAVANFLRLLNLPEDLLDLVREGQLSAGHARVLAGIEDAELQRRLAQAVLEDGLNVRQLEALAAQARASKPDPKPQRRPRDISPELSGLERRMRDTLGLRATLTGSEKRGRIVLQYYTAEELEHLNDLLLQLSGESPD